MLREIILFITVCFIFYVIQTKETHQLTGRIITKISPDYNKARLVSNYYTSKNKYPKAIVYCNSDNDVRNAILWAREQKLHVRIRSGAHNHEGFSTGDNAMVIDVSRMKRVQIDKEKNIATIEPGITGNELYTLLARHGLTQAGGTCADVGISGLVLTGGMGPLSRKYGLTCDTLVSLDMVDAQGRLLHLTKDNKYKDLFWACCGGGAGNFGVVTSLVLRIFPLREVSYEITWFNIGWDWNDPVKDIIKKWQEFFLKDDKRWFSHLDVWAKQFPKDKLKKQPIKVIGIYYGSLKEARRLLEPFLTLGKPTVTIEKVDWRTAIKEFEDSTTVFLTDKPEYKSTGAFATQLLPEKALDTIVNTLKNSTSPLLNFLMFSLGGAIKDKSPTDTAYFYRDANFFLCYSSQWLNAKDDKKHIQELDSLRNNLLPYAQGDYTGNPDLNLKDYLTTYYGDNVDRLITIKKKYDPDNLFYFEQGIPTRMLKKKFNE